MAANYYSKYLFMWLWFDIIVLVNSLSRSHSHVTHTRLTKLCLWFSDELNHYSGCHHMFDSRAPVSWRILFIRFRSSKTKASPSILILWLWERLSTWINLRTNVRFATNLSNQLNRCTLTASRNMGMHLSLVRCVWSRSNMEWKKRSVIWWITPTSITADNWKRWWVSSENCCPVHSIDDWFTFSISVDTEWIQSGQGIQRLH